MSRVDHRLTARLYRSSFARPSLIYGAQLHPTSYKMAESSQTGLSAEGAAIKQEKPPKLSLADFRTYNSMADHMEMFVGLPPNDTISSGNTDKPAAQQFPPDLENALRRLLQRATAFQHVTPSVPHHGPRLLPSSGNAPFD